MRYERASESSLIDGIVRFGQRGWRRAARPGREKSDYFRRRPQRRATLGRMNFMEAMAGFPVLRLRLTVTARETLKLPRDNKGNTLRGAFGGLFRQLACVPECREAKSCPLDAVERASGEAHPCPYREIFEPAPPKWAGRLSRNQDAPRPFVFRPPLTEQTTWQPGESFDFELLLFGRATRALPWFVLAFRAVTESGFGLNRAKCELSRVVALRPDEREDLIYRGEEATLREAAADTIAAWIAEPLAKLRILPQSESVRIVFLTPTLLKAADKVVVAPEFHHLLKRIRDRVNALSSFYGPGPIEADFAGIGRLAEEVQTASEHLAWKERSRTSSRTGQRHALAGVEGAIEIKMAPADGEILLPWLTAGQLTHVGRYSVWGFGEIGIMSPDRLCRKLWN